MSEKKLVGEWDWYMVGFRRLTVGAGHHAVNTETGVLLLELARLDRGKSLNGAQTRVLGEGQGNSIQRISEGAHGILLNAGALGGGIFDGERASNLSSTATVDNTVITDKVADDAESIV